MLLVEIERNQILMQTFKTWDRNIPNIVSEDNCADKTMVTERLLTVACMENGKLEVILIDSYFQTKVYEQRKSILPSTIAEDMAYIQHIKYNIS